MISLSAHTHTPLRLLLFPTRQIRNPRPREVKQIVRSNQTVNGKARDSNKDCPTPGPSFSPHFHNTLTRIPGLRRKLYVKNSGQLIAEIPREQGGSEGAWLCLQTLKSLFRPKGAIIFALYGPEVQTIKHCIWTFQGNAFMCKSFPKEREFRIDIVYLKGNQVSVIRLSFRLCNHLIVYF